MDWRPRGTSRPLVYAFFVSLFLHAMLFTAIEAANRYDLWRYNPFVLLANALERVWKQTHPASALQPNPPASTPKPVQEEQPVEMMFVDVDPSQATDEVPPDTPFYSPVNSVAANPYTARDSERVQFDGEQDKVLKTKESHRANPSPQPMRPAVPPVEDTVARLEPELPRPAPPTPTRLNPAPLPPPPAPAPEPDKPGETLVARATPVAPPPTATPAPAAPEPTAAPPQPQPRPRPRTLAAARALHNINPDSALVGQKMKQPGGVKRFAIESSLGVKASPLGSYDAQFVAAVQECWFQLLDEQRYSLDRMGKVILDFRLKYDGTIQEMRVAESDVGDIYTSVCIAAIQRPAPYGKWPDDVRKMVGGSYRDVRFTFYY